MEERAGVRLGARAFLQSAPILLALMLVAGILTRWSRPAAAPALSGKGAW